MYESVHRLLVILDFISTRNHAAAGDRSYQVIRIKIFVTEVIRFRCAISMQVTPNFESRVI